MFSVANKMNRSSTRRRHQSRPVLRLVGAVTVASVLTSVGGCETLPTPDGINRQYDSVHDLIDRLYFKFMEGCAELGEPTKTECETFAREWRLLRHQEAIDARDAAINNNWQDAYDRRKALEEALRDLIPDFPDLRDITEPLFSGSIATIDLEIAPVPSSAFSGMMAAAAAAAPPCDTVLVTGWGSLTAGSFDASTVVSGSLCITGVEGPGNSYTGSVVSGQIVAQMDFGPTLTLTVVNDPANEIVTDASGQGQMTVLFTSDYSVFEWNAILPHYTRYQLQVARDAQGVFHIEGGPIESWKLQGHTPHPSSDYNLDGVLDYATDSAAFLLDLSANEGRADINVDNVWDAADVQLWEDNFWLDVLRQ